ncbi:hypothetical protein J437_LFUL008715 [Ladona fulva]|uniref:Transposase n=1 Tax=Ladona fulva TaxID=123851 RepID=A0A8K0K837_LADFU|nr:hypothetical protein J437_LFUL008715 [Ladona fulva]
MDKLYQENKKRKVDGDHSEYQTAKRQALLSRSLKGSSSVSQGVVDTLILGFVINMVQPFSVVEEESFFNLIKGLASSPSVMCRKTLISRLAERYGALKNRLVGELALASAAAIMADCWSHFNKSFMGITVHWIDEKTLARRSAMLTVDLRFNSFCFGFR